jgi:hypothetical protein
VSQEASRIRSTPTLGNKTVLVLALVAGTGFVIGFVFPYFRLTPESFGVYWQKRGWLLLHITTGTIALLLGPFALWLGLARRRMHLHRMLGVTYMVSTPM